MFTHDSSLKRISDFPKEFQLFRACGNTDISGGIGGSIAGGMNGIIGMVGSMDGGPGNIGRGPGNTTEGSSVLSGIDGGRPGRNDGSLAFTVCHQPIRPRFGNFDRAAASLISHPAPCLPSTSASEFHQCFRIKHSGLANYLNRPFDAMSIPFLSPKQRGIAIAHGLKFHDKMPFHDACRVFFAKLLRSQIFHASPLAFLCDAMDDQRPFFPGQLCCGIILSAHARHPRS